MGQGFGKGTQPSNQPSGKQEMTGEIESGSSGHRTIPDEYAGSLLRDWLAEVPSLWQRVKGGVWPSSPGQRWSSQTWGLPSSLPHPPSRVIFNQFETRLFIGCRESFSSWVFCLAGMSFFAVPLLVCGCVLGTWWEPGSQSRRPPWVHTAMVKCLRHPF